MSATNQTTHYELPVFIATDKPAWLVDWNGSMNAIDAAIYGAKSAADTAQAGVDANTSNISTLSSTVTSQGSSLSTLSENLTTLTGTVNTITSLIGNGEPTTTDKTIIGAINEINAEISSPTAAGISYDNTTSGLTADDVQEAIDEVAGDVDTINSSLIAIGTSETLGSTYGQGTKTITLSEDIDKYRFIMLVFTTGGSFWSLANTIIPTDQFKQTSASSCIRLASSTFTSDLYYTDDTTITAVNSDAACTVMVYGIK